VSDATDPAASAGPGEKGRVIFRDAALARLNSPEQLDQRIAVMPPAMRILAGGTAIILLACLAWAVFGEVPTRAAGRGVLLSDDREGNFAIAAVSSGLVLQMLAKPGDHVVAGAEIASIEQKLLSAQVAAGMDEVRRLEASLALFRASNLAQIRQSDETALRQLAAINEQLAAGTVRLGRQRELVTSYEGLRAKGLVPQKEVLANQVDLDQTALDLANAKAKKIEIEAAAQKKRDDLAELERQKLEEIDSKTAEVENLRVQLTIGSVVKAPISGIIREVRFGRGDVAAAGAVLATIGQDTSGHLEVMALMPGPKRKRVAVGMEAYISPDGTKKEEFGTMRGRVVWVSDNDVSSEYVEQILLNAQLTKTLMGDGSPLIARIEVFPSKATPSGFEWWSGSGPDYKITAGSIATVDVIVGRARPISLVIPALRKLLSLQG
jgi:HlyD family secretion protein